MTATIPTPTAASAGALVLVVDDEASICSSVSSVLNDEGYRTIVAHDGPEALKLATEQSPNLIFLDIWMPGWDGIETLRRIKAVCPETEVIVISGHATIQNALEATRRGAFDFIEKPLSIESIVFTAARALEKQRDSSLKHRAPSADEAESAEDMNAALGNIPALFRHPGLSSNGLKGRNVGQRTLKKSAILYGQCLHSGQKSGLILEPLPKNSGIHFSRIGDSQSAPAFVDNVESTGFATTIRSGSNATGTIEHLMATLHAYRISNLLIKCNAEVPIFDGSALQFCETIEQSGIEEQGGEWFEIAVDRPIAVASADPKKPDEKITLEPSDRFSVRYELRYPAPINTQIFEFTCDTAEHFKKDIAPARTFGFMRDIEKLQRAGLAAGGRLNNFILIGDDKVINTDLRYPEELARHKILDAIGDLFLIGRPLRAKVNAVMTGHSDNVKVLRALRQLIEA